jgi:GNAT superfamily N-acetyltransferase
MARQGLVVQAGLQDAHRRRAAQGFWDAFERKLRYPLGPERKGVAFIERVLDGSHCFSAVSDAGAFLGVAGFKTDEGAYVGGELADMAAVYGWFGAIWRGTLVSVLERPCAEGILLMDGIFVETAARGQGVGSALLAAVEGEAARRGLRQVRLDVIDANPRARALYERQGFEADGEMSLGLLGSVFGFSSATRMYKTVRA